MVRNSPGGDILYLDEFDTLHEWIVEREVDRTWEISRTGDAWKKLGGIGEFEPMFQAVESASDVHRAESAEGLQSTARAAHPDESGGSEPRVRASTQSQFEESGEGRETPGQQGDVAATDSVEEATQPDARQPMGESEEGGSGEVRLETGRFGDEPSETADAGADDIQEDEWSFEGETQPDAASGIDEDDPIEHFDDEIAYDQSRRWPYVIGLLVVAGVAGYAWFARPVWLMTYVDGMTSSQSEPISESSPATGPDAGQREEAPVVTARQQVMSALAASRDEADEREAETISEVVVEIRARRGDAIDAARKVAKRRAERAAQSKEQASAARLLSRARNALQNGQAPKARQLYQKAVDRSPGNAEALTGLGWALIEMGRSQNAVSNFSRAREANPNFGEAYIGLARAQRNIGRYRQALETYQAYLSSFPNGPKASIAQYQSEQLRKQLGM
jgi:tetratricopeptide (TPR) repeat protein